MLRMEGDEGQVVGTVEKLPSPTADGQEWAGT